MANKAAGNQRSSKNKGRGEARAPQAFAPPAAVATWKVVAGTLFLVLAIASSFLLVNMHVSGLSLPGCGPGSACEQAEKSVWGQVPGVNWPTSFLGLGYFLAALVGWVAARGALPTALRYIARLGALGSVFFCAIIVIEKLACPYCIAAHIGNLAFWLLTEFSRGRPRRVAPPIGLAVGAFVVASAAMGGWDAQQRASAARKAEAEREAAAQQIIAAGGKNTANQPPTSTTSKATTTAPATTALAPVGEPPFTGRYRRGPEVAAIRIVMITDYQCPDCRNIEKQAEEILRERTDTSLSVKHFPFDAACNPEIKRSLHPNACWAARAAEAAGILWGNDGFWKMHDWLFEQKGEFVKDEDLLNGVRQCGYDPAGFIDTMKSPETLQRIQADIKEANTLGLFFTPMIFINGVELKGWSAPNALKRTVAQVAAANPPPQTAAADHPPVALRKYIEDWRDAEALKLPADSSPWTLGPPDAPTWIVLWGDYQESGTADADRTIRQFMTGRRDVRYTFRHCPFNSDCNSMIPFRRHPLACWASRAAEAAGRLGGNDAYWRMHAWLMDNSDAALKTAATQFKVDPNALRDALYTMSDNDRKAGAAKLRVDADAVLAAMQKYADDSLRAAAKDMGLDMEALLAKMNDADVLAAIKDDIEAGKKLPVLRYGTPPGLHGIPTIFIDSKLVPRITLEGRQVLDVILNEAVKK